MYKHIFFDLDDTVWDYRANARETLLEIYHEEGLEELDKFEAEEFVTTFTEINYRLWDELDKGIITRFTPSPDGNYLLTENIHKPYSFSYFYESR